MKAKPVRIYPETPIKEIKEVKSKTAYALWLEWLAATHGSKPKKKV
jgi:hypothetical protein